MNLEYFKNFITIVETGSMSKAAEKLLVAQPALSRQIHIIESEYGVPLFESGRGAHRLRLTDAGWIFYRQARKLCLLDDDTRKQIENYSEGVQGTLRISLAPSRAPFFVNRYALPFTKKYPNVHYDLREAGADELIENVRRGDSEIGIANAIVPDLSIFKILFKRKENFVAVAPIDRAQHIKRDTVSIADLATENVVIPRAHVAMFDAAATSSSTRRNIIATGDTRQTAMRFAEEGLAWALIPWEAIEALPPRVVSFTLEGLDNSALKTIFCMRDRTLSPVMKTFLTVYAEELHRQLPDA